MPTSAKPLKIKKAIVKTEQNKKRESAPPVVKTEHKKINIINKETVVVEQILAKKEEKTEVDLKTTDEPVKQIKFSAINIPVFNDKVLGVKTTSENQFNQHLFSPPPELIQSAMKTTLNDPEKMLWYK